MNAVRQLTAAVLLGATLAAGCTARPASTGPAYGAALENAVQRYYPAPDRWEQRPPAALGFDAARLQEAAVFAQANETPWPTDLRKALEASLATGPYGEIVGPLKDRGGPAGLIVRNGYIAAEWGDTRRVDLTFSVSKSYLATLAGLALDAGLIRDLNDPVRAYVPDSLFAGPRNNQITWRQLLNQTSEWEGTLWGKPDLADRRAGRDRTLQMPGTFWEYNDVRVNLLALALLHVWKKPLPRVLEEQIMDPIGASDTWEWHGYRNSYVEIGGERMQSVSGGAHWGGGVWASTRDHARFGLLHARLGEWGGRQLLPESWIRAATAPTPLRPVYGYMWWLNTDRKQFPSAPATSFFALGAGSNVIWIDPVLDLVAVVRWIDNRQIDAFIARVMSALRPLEPAGAGS